MSKKWRMREVVFGTDTRNKREKSEEEIINSWKKAWQTDGNILPQTASREEKCFEEWLTADLEFLQSGQYRNRKKNFFMKALSIIVFIVSYVVLNWWNICNQNSNLLTPILSLIPPYVVCQWINVKKYQETWGRYANYYGLILQEMVKYIYRLNPYHENDLKKKKQIFIDKILFLTNGNGEKFYNNMTKKEKEMYLENIIKKKLV